MTLMRLALACLIAAGLAVALGAQTATSQQRPPQPTFRAGVSLVRVDVYPTLNGQAVPDLRQDEFEVLEDGVAQRVETFERIAIRTPVPEIERSEPTSVDMMNEALAEPRNRVFVLFLDTHHTRNDRFMNTNYAEAQRERPPRPADSGRTNRALTTFLQRLVGPDDLIALMTPEMSVNAVTFTRRPASIEEFLQTMPWQREGQQFDLDPQEQLYVQCYGMSMTTAQMVDRRREAMVLSALRGLVVHLRSLREERKAILVVTQGWTLFRPGEIAGNSVARPPQIGIRGGKPTIGDPRNYAPIEACERDRMTLSNIDDEREFRDILQLANRSNASFYPIDPSGLEAPFGPDWARYPGVSSPWSNVDSAKYRQDSLRSLAAETDGMAVINTNDISVGLKRITSDLSSYYLLGYYPTNSKADGKFRKITVRVKRKGVTIRARRGYLAASEADLKAERDAGERAATPPDPEVAALDRALAALDRGRDDRTILLRGGYTWPLQASASRDATLVVVAELDAAAAKGPGWEQGGELSASLLDLDGRTLSEATGRITPAARTCLIRFPGAPLPPGDYLARVKARWSVLMTTDQVRIRVPDVAAKSILGDAIVYRRGPYSGPGFQPTADLRFRRAERVRVDVPLAGPVDATSAQLLDRKGKPLALPVAVQQRDDAAERLVTAELGLAPLAPGDYVVEVSARRGDKTEKVLTAVRIVP